MQNQSDLSVLLEKIKTLRNKKTGCPWMLEQTLQTIVPHTLEEAYEVADAVESKKMPALRDELGDLLYSILIYADMANEQGDFSFTDVIKSLDQKIIRRHPHMFNNSVSPQALTIEQLEKNWGEIKRQESNNQKSVLSAVPLNLPALSYAQKIQKNAAEQGFDWEHSEGVFEKLKEEIQEYQQALSKTQADNIQEELGDILFTVVNLIRHHGFNSEQTLRLANQKFVKRFQLLEKDLEAQGKGFKECTTAELENIWAKVKNL